MQWITVYIILVALVWAVIFLFTNSLIVHKKHKKLKLQKNDDGKKKVSGIKMNILNNITTKNESLLKIFKLSVGKLKISEAQAKSNDTILVLKKFEFFTFFNLSDFKYLLLIFDKLKRNNLNIWQKQLGNKIKIIRNIIKSDLKIKIINSEIQKIIIKINKIYENTMT